VNTSSTGCFMDRMSFLCAAGIRRHLLACWVDVAGGRLVVAVHDSVLLLDSELAVDRVLLHSDNDDNTERFSRPLRLNYSSRRLLVACRSQFVNVYSWRPSSLAADSLTRPET